MSFIYSCITFFYYECFVSHSILSGCPLSSSSCTQVDASSSKDFGDFQGCLCLLLILGRESSELEAASLQCYTLIVHVVWQPGQTHLYTCTAHVPQPSLVKKKHSSSLLLLSNLGNCATAHACDLSRTEQSRTDYLFDVNLTVFTYSNLLYLLHHFKRCPLLAMNCLRICCLTLVIWSSAM